MGFSGFDQILQSSIWSFRQHSAFAWSHRHHEFRFRAHHLIVMQQLSNWSQVVYIGGCDDDRVDQA